MRVCSQIAMNFKTVSEESKHRALQSVDPVPLHRSQAHKASPAPIPGRMRSVPNKGRVQCFGNLQKEMTSSDAGESKRGFMGSMQKRKLQMDT